MRDRVRVRRRGVPLAALLSVALTMAAIAAPSVAGSITHPREISAFQDYVRTFSANPGAPQRDKVWATDHPEQILAEGDRACDWLSHRPYAPKVDPSGDSDVATMANRYLALRQGEGVPLPLSREAHRVVVIGAWAYLCWSDRRDKTAPVSLAED